MNLAQRSITSSAYNITANIITLVVRFIGSILLARLLIPEIFGTFTLVMSVIQLTLPLPSFGFHAGILHLTAGKKGVSDEILRVSFTLRFLFGLVWTVLIAAGVVLFAPEHTRWVFWVVISISFINMQMDTIHTLLTRQVQFRRLALAQAVGAVASTIVSVGVAWWGGGIWALVCGQITSTLVAIILLVIIRPVWRLRFGWSAELVRFFLKFGGKFIGTALLLQALDRFDDIWTGTVLGEQALGFYDKAYGFATYPRKVLTAPIIQVVVGAYTELLDNRPRFSQVFSWVNILMARVNFLIAAVIWLIAPEFIRLLLGSQWLPMLSAFRLMLIYTMFDPLKHMISSVIILSDAAERVIRVRLIQLSIMLVGLFTLGPNLGIAGVALAVDAMLVVGMVLFYAEARRFVDFSLKKIFIVPALALGLGVGVVRAGLSLLNLAGNDWLTGFFKASLFSLVYCGVLISVERAQLMQALDYLISVIKKESDYAGEQPLEES